MSLGFNKTHTLNAARHPVMATIVTANFEDTLTAYTEILGYEKIDTGELSEQMARNWGLSGLSGARLALLRPESGAPVFLRFVEVKTAKRSIPACGWFALEICVKDVEALHERLIESEVFIPFAKPKPLEFTDRVYPMQCKGPAGEILYLNEVRGSLPDIDLPIAKSDVDHLFIAILSAADMEHSNEFYCNALDMTVNERHEIAYKTINRVHGLPLDTRHKLSTLGGHRHVGLEIDQYPGLANPPRPMKEDRMVEGILMVSYLSDVLDAVPNRLVAPPETFEQFPYMGAQTVVLIGPAGERTELIKMPNKSQTL